MVGTGVVDVDVVLEAAVVVVAAVVLEMLVVVVVMTSVIGSAVVVVVVTWSKLHTNGYILSHDASFHPATPGVSMLPTRTQFSLPR